MRKLVTSVSCTCNAGWIKINTEARTKAGPEKKNTECQNLHFKVPKNRHNKILENGKKLEKLGGKCLKPWNKTKKRGKNEKKKK